VVVNFIDIWNRSINRSKPPIYRKSHWQLYHLMLHRVHPRESNFKFQIIVVIEEGVSNSCTTRGTRRVILVTNPVISHEWGKGHIVIITNVDFHMFYLISWLHAFCLSYSYKYKLLSNAKMPNIKHFIRFCYCYFMNISASLSALDTNNKNVEI
jgi:hypothetical protein